jgi:hypothetical protein
MPNEALFEVNLRGLKNQEETNYYIFPGVDALKIGCWEATMF